MERHQRRFGDRSGEYELEGGNERAGVWQIAGEDCTQQWGLSRHGNDDHADKHRQTAEGRNQQCLHGGTAGGSAAGVVSDQHEGEHAGRFPKYKHQVDVVGSDQSVHNAGKTGEGCGESSERWFVVRKISVAVQQHECADDGDNHRQYPAEHVDAHIEVEPKLRNPGNRLGDRAGV